MGTRRARQKQEELFYASERAEAPGHPFYEQLNGVLDDAGFDKFCGAMPRFLSHEAGTAVAGSGRVFSVVVDRIL